MRIVYQAAGHADAWQAGSSLTVLAWVPHSGEVESGAGLMRAGLALLAVALAAGPAFADKRLDPDPSFLPKARTTATAKVEPHYDLPSEKAPFWVRFLICAGQLTAIRDEGRALPASKDEIDKLITGYRGRAADLLAHRAKADPKASALDADTEIARIRTGAMEFLPGDVTKIGVDTMKKRAAERLAFCQLTRDWYDVQNGTRVAAAPAEQQKLQQVHDEAMKKIAAEAPKPPKVPDLRPMPPALKPKVVQPEARVAAPRGPEAEPLPAQKVAVPAAGFAGGSPNPNDAIVGSDITHAGARADFLGRPLWSALAECSARMEYIQVKTGDPAKLQSDSYAHRAAYTLYGNRTNEIGAGALAAMNAPVAQERRRLAPRVEASWVAYRQEHGGALPHAHWGQVCWGLDQYALALATRLHAARKQRADREYQEALKRFNESSPSGGTVTTSGGYGGVSSNSSLDAAAAASRAEHQRNMDQFKRDTDRIKQEIRAIDRKYR